MGGCLRGQFLGPLHLQSAMYTSIVKSALTSALGEDDTQNISECRERDEDRQDTLSTSTEHVAEEGSSNDASRANDICFGHCGKVRNLKSVRREAP
jgi:hypothetical protein